MGQKRKSVAKPQKRKARRTGVSKPRSKKTTSASSQVADQGVASSAISLNITQDLRDRALKILEGTRWLYAPDATSSLDRRLTSARRRSKPVLLQPVDIAAGLGLKHRLSILGTSIRTLTPGDFEGHLERLVFHEEDENKQNQLRVIQNKCALSESDDERLIYVSDLDQDPLTFETEKLQIVLSYVEHLLPSPLLSFAKHISTSWVKHASISPELHELILAFLMVFGHELIVEPSYSGDDVKREFENGLEDSHRSLVTFCMELLLQEESDIPTGGAQPEPNEAPPDVRETVNETLPLLNVTIGKDHQGSIQVQTDGKHKVLSKGKMRTFVTLALLRNFGPFTSNKFCTIYFGVTNQYPSARFGGSVNSAGLKTYKVGDHPCSFPKIAFHLDGVGDVDLWRFLRGFFEPEVQDSLRTSGKWDKIPV